MSAQEENTMPQVSQPIRRPSMPFRPDIEGLRALAILLVVISHSGLPFLQSGFIGVDVFFVLSGFLITGLLVEEFETTGGIRFSRFYARRARRLLPAAMLLVLVVSCVEAVVISPLMQFRVLKAALATVFYSSNIYFAHLDLHYFEQESGVNPLLHTWSLAVEEQFYLVWPILLLVVMKLGKSRKVATFALTAVAALSLALCIRLTSISPSSAFFEAPARAWEFCAGAFLVYLPVGRLAKHKRIISILGLVGVALLLGCAQFTRPEIFPGYVAAFPVLGTMFVLLAGATAPGSMITRLLSTRPAQLLGGLSYSFYLWHWPALVIGRQLFPSGSGVVRGVALCAAFALAASTHRIVENPIRFNPYLVSRVGLSLKLAVLVAIFLTCALGGWRLALNRSAQFHKFDQALRDIPVIYGSGCVPERPDREPLVCAFGEKQEPKATALLFGDSHAAEWFPALSQIADDLHWRLDVIVKPGCTPLYIHQDISPLMEQVCDDWRRLAVAKIQQMHPDLVIVSSASLHPVAGGQMMTDAAVWEQGARDMFSALTASGAQVRFIRDTPHANYNVLECMAQAQWDGKTHCPAIQPAEALYPEIYAAEVQGASGVANVGFIDLSDQTCSAGECYAEVDGIVVYRDNDHLTATFNRSLAPVLAQRLSSTLKK